MTEDLRGQMRTKIFASETRRGKNTKLPFYGTEIEIRQPNIGQVQKWSDNDSDSVTLIEILLNHAYVPGTDIKVFESADRDTLQSLPMNEEATAVIAAIQAFTDLAIKDSEKN